ncbi:MAG: hypothetical protein OEY01_03835 [Desulfobulbaceae bacterium]|nr:hypothetical protein [Desulfobulbaceae bacterium]
MLDYQDIAKDLIGRGFLPVDKSPEGKATKGKNANTVLLEYSLADLLYMCQSEIGYSFFKLYPGDEFMFFMRIDYSLLREDDDGTQEYKVSAQVSPVREPEIFHANGLGTGAYLGKAFDRGIHLDIEPITELPTDVDIETRLLRFLMGQVLTIQDEMSSMWDILNKKELI